jgi:plasmid stability protein
MDAGLLGTIACMSQAQLIDMSSARVNVEAMSKMIQIRNVPDDLHRQLKIRAAAAGMSMSDYLKRELDIRTRKSTIPEIIARREASGRKSTSTTQQLVEIIRETRGD